MSEVQAAASHESAPQNETTPEQEIQQQPKYQVKLPDGMREVDLDELIRGYQLDKASYKRFEEASAKEKAAMEREAKFKLNWLDTLMNDPDIDKETAKQKMIEFLSAEFEKEDMSPEQRELQELRQEKLKREQEEKARQEALHNEELEKEATEEEQRLIQSFASALDSVDLPPTTNTLRAMAHIHEVLEDRGIDVAQADPKELARITHATLLSEQNDLLQQAMKRGDVRKHIHPGVLKAIREEDLKEIRSRKAKGQTLDLKDKTDFAGKKLLSPDEALKRFLEE